MYSFFQEREERTQQTCLIQEREHLVDATQLRRTYAYIKQLTPEERKLPINEAIIQSLPNLEREARIDRAPDYCDAPGVALPEPDPKIPERPEGLL